MLTIVVCSMFTASSRRVMAVEIALPAKAAHPVSIIEADVLVTKKKTTMRLRCFAEDLELIQGVEPYEDGKYDTDELLDSIDDHATC